MSVQRNIEIINEILANIDNPHDEKNMQIVRELGYLIGFLARIANHDSQVYHALKQELARLQQKQNKHLK
jgi:hypothetical protein